MFPNNGITILDSSIRKDEIRILKSHSEILGFNIKNETGEHLFVELVWNGSNIKEIIIKNERHYLISQTLKMEDLQK